jgi:hypothetical protein
LNDQYNPFVAELTAVSDKFKSNAALKDNTHTELAWYKAFDKDGTHVNLNALQNAVRQSQAALDRVMLVLVKHNDAVKQAAKKARLGFNPLYWMSSERQVAVRAHEEALRQMAPFEREYNDTSAKKKQYASEARERQEAMDRYRAFDLLQAEDMIRFLQQEQEALERQFTYLSRRAQDAETLLRPTWEHLQQCMEREKTLLADIAVAQRMDDEMTRAKHDGYRRKLIHQRCEAQFQDANPYRVRANLERELHGVRSTIEKTRKRLEIDTVRLTRDVRMLVIDGSNLLNKHDHGHDNGNQFIGLAALDALMPALADKVEKLILFFDHGAPKKLGMSEQALRERFARWAKEVIVTPVNSPADDTILAAANKNRHAYVISRDRYGDYLALYPWIKERVFAPVIANGTVHVHDLFLDVPFSQVQ